MLRGTRRRTPPRPRQAVRYRTPGLRCPIGEVVDLSSSGMRLQGRGRSPVRRGEHVDLALEAQGQRLGVRGRVVWMRRVSVLRYQLGVQFVGLTRAKRAALEQLARFGFIGSDAGEGAACGPRPAGGRVSAAVEIEDLYAVLGVDPDASPEEIQAVYRRLAREFHPDVTPEPHAQERFAAISKAYRVLRDPERRRRYDALAARCAA